jgi:hypothetical protein
MQTAQAFFLFVSECKDYKPENEEAYFNAE